MEEKEIVENAETESDEETEEEPAMIKCGSCGAEYTMDELSDNGNELVCDDCL